MLRTLSLVFFVAVAACSALPTSDTSPAQQAVNLTAATCKDNDLAMVAADKAVLSGALKGSDARNALKGLTTIQTACVSTLAGLQAAAAAASGPTPAASGAKP